MKARCGFLYLALCFIPTIGNAAQPDPSLDVYARPQQLVDIGGRRLNLYCLRVTALQP